MAFLNTRLPTAVELGATGGLGFSTTITPLKSGYEKRNANRENMLGEWDIGYAMDTLELRRAVWELHIVAMGMWNSFRFKDHADFELDRQSIGTTDGTTATFPLYKRYTVGAYTFDRTLTKPVSGSASAWVDNTARTVVYDTSPTATQVAVNTLTGIITLGSTLVAMSAKDIEIACQFDIPVRFMVDKLDRQMLMPGYASVPNVSIREVLGE